MRAFSGACNYQTLTDVLYACLLLDVHVNFVHLFWSAMHDVSDVAHVRVAFYDLILLFLLDHLFNQELSLVMVTSVTSIVKVYSCSSKLLFFHEIHTIMQYMYL
jgi:hypothetical protein